MRVAVKNMSGEYLYYTTPRKVRLLLRDKKAVVESNNPFTIRLLFSESECGLKDFKPKNKDNAIPALSNLNTSIKLERGINMEENTINNKNSDCEPLLNHKSKYSEYNAIRKNHFECFIKELDIDFRILCTEFSHKDNKIIISVYLCEKASKIISKLENKFYTICLLIYYPDGEDFCKTVYKAKFDHEEKYEHLSYEGSDNLKIKLIFTDVSEYTNPSKIHLIYGCDHVDERYFLDSLVDHIINNKKDAFLLTRGRVSDNECSIHLVHINDTKYLSGDNLCKMDNMLFKPIDFIKYIIGEVRVKYKCIDIDTIIVEHFRFSEINKEYSDEEFFKELVNVCKERNINLIYVFDFPCIDGLVMNSIPQVYEEFSNIVTMFK